MSFRLGALCSGSSSRRAGMVKKARERGLCAMREGRWILQPSPPASTDHGHLPTFVPPAEVLPGSIDINNNRLHPTPRHGTPRHPTAPHGTARHRINGDPATPLPCCFVADDLQGIAAAERNPSLVACVPRQGRTPRIISSRRKRHLRIMSITNFFLFFS